MAYALPGGISPRQQSRLSKKLRAMRKDRAGAGDRATTRGGHDADGDFDGDISRDGGYPGAQAAMRGATPANSNIPILNETTAERSKLAPFGDRSRDDGRGLPGDLKRGQIDEQRFQQMPRMSRGADVGRPRANDTGSDHINQRAYARKWPDGSNAREQGPVNPKSRGGVLRSTPIYGGPPWRPTDAQ